MLFVSGWQSLALGFCYGLAAWVSIINAWTAETACTAQYRQKRRLRGCRQPAHSCDTHGTAGSARSIRKFECFLVCLFVFYLLCVAAPVRQAVWGRGKFPLDKNTLLCYFLWNKRNFLIINSHGCSSLPPLPTRSVTAAPSPSAHRGWRSNKLPAPPTARQWGPLWSPDRLLFTAAVPASQNAMSLRRAAINLLPPTKYEEVGGGEK